MNESNLLRDDIRELTTHLIQVRQVSLISSGAEIAKIGKKCKRVADSIGNLINFQGLPYNNKVAEIGSFKRSKSSFINEHLDANLANDDTNSETDISRTKHAISV